jgi:hypothetical protein
MASSREAMDLAARVVHEAAKLELAMQGKQSKGPLKKGKKGAGPAASVASVLQSLGGLAAGIETEEAGRIRRRCSKFVRL